MRPGLQLQALHYPGSVIVVSLRKRKAILTFSKSTFPSLDTAILAF
jgi:hypothetical protein